MITGVQTALSLLPRTIPQNTFPPTNPQPSPQSRRTTTASPEQLKPTQHANNITTPRPTIRSQLNSLHKARYPPSNSKRQQIWEPVDTKRKTQTIHPSIFYREMNNALSEDLQIKTPIEAVRRLPRGGFLVQYTQEAAALTLKLCTSPQEYNLTLPTLDMWAPTAHRDPLTSHPSVILAGISPDLPEPFVETELKEYNDIPGMDLKSSYVAARRLNRRNPATQKIEPSRSLRLFLDTPGNAKALIAHGTVSIGGLLALVRPYTPPTYFCLNCKKQGTHRTNDCRRPKSPTALAQDCRHTPDPEPMDTEMEGVHPAQ